MGQYIRRVVRRTRTRVIPSWNNHRPVAQCPCCGQWTYRDCIVEQKDYRGGSAPVPTGRYACERCIDQPQPYFKKQVLPPDPIPVVMPFPDNSGNEDEFPTYASVGALPAASSLPAGYAVNVTIDSVEVRAYSDSINWRLYSSNEVIA